MNARPRQVHLVSLGCPKARVDAELMAGLVRAQGAELTDDPEAADTIIVNTCAFLESATQESVDTVLELAQLRDAGRLERLVVTGCMVQRYGAELAEALPEVDLFLGTNEIARIGEAVAAPDLGDLPERTYLSEGSHLYRAGDPRFPITLGASTYLKISEGCNRTCSFCIIPGIRGKQVSRPVPDLLREAEQLAAMGIKELVLVAQDLTSYGVDLGVRDGLVRLLRGLEEVDGLRWVRLMYAYPWNVTDELVELLGAGGKLLPYVDMPLQHISDRILQSMRRNVRRDAQAALLAKLRAVPGMVLRTTFIAGYPGETEAEHQELCDWLQEVEFDRVGVFPYSPEQGTRAADLPDQLPDEVKQARVDALMGLQQAISDRRQQARVGTTLEVLVDGPSEEHEFVLEGRYYGQAPEVDGSVFLSFDDDSPLARPGELVRAEVEAASPYDLVARVLPG